jgi:hypothetical protein
VPPQELVPVREREPPLVLVREQQERTGSNR